MKKQETSQKQTPKEKKSKSCSTYVTEYMKTFFHDHLSIVIKYNFKNYIKKTPGIKEVIMKQNKNLTHGN